MHSSIYISADMAVAIDGLSAGGTYLNAATVTYALKDADGTTVTGGTGSLTYTPASDGDYTGTIESTVTSLLTENAIYYLHVTISQSSYNDFRRLTLRALYRDED